jgi:hypothetical protein
MPRSFHIDSNKISMQNNDTVKLRCIVTNKLSSVVAEALKHDDLK